MDVTSNFETYLSETTRLYAIRHAEAEWKINASPLFSLFLFLTPKAAVYPLPLLVRHFWMPPNYILYSDKKKKVLLPKMDHQK